MPGSACGMASCVALQCNITFKWNRPQGDACPIVTLYSNVIAFAPDLMALHDNLKFIAGTR
jgi:hypothetical protein